MPMHVPHEVSFLNLLTVGNVRGSQAFASHSAAYPALALEDIHGQRRVGFY